MIDLTGTSSLIRFTLRRDRVYLPVWIVAIVGLVYASTRAVRSTYSTPARIQSYADTLGDSAAAIAMGGPPVALDTIGGIVIYETSISALVGVALMAIFVVVRHTRADEDAGRTELIRSTVVGHHAPLAAVFVVAAGASVLVGLGITASMLAVDVPSSGATLFGAAVAALGLVFIGVAACASQVMSHARGALGVSIAALAAAFMLRAIGDIGNVLWSWLSPMGWSQQVRALDENRWWPLALSVALTACTMAVSVAIINRRDLGAGIVAPRPGPPRAARWMANPVGLSLRLQRGTLIGWTVGVFVGGLMFGSFSEEVEQLVEDNPTLADVLTAAGGGTLTENFFATALLIMSLIGSAFAVASALRIRHEEAEGRLEPLVATAVSRTRWLLGGLLVTTVGAVVVVAAGGLGIGLAHGIVSGDGGAPLRMLAESLVYVPAVLVLAALAAVLVGWIPDAAIAVWAPVVLCFVIGWLGGVLDLPRWVELLSPFTHTPQVPVDDVSVGALAVLAGLAAAGTALAVVGFRRRDIG